MPELPEVETVRRGLERHLPGRTIRRVEVRSPKIIVRPDWQSFVIELTGQPYQRLRRHGKLLILELESVTLLVHLGMTGQLTFRDPARADAERFHVQPHTGLQQALQHAPDQHTHVVLHHTDGTQVCYRDVRKFGKWRLYSREEAAGCAELAALGPDPLTPAFTLDAFAGELSRTTRQIKAVLLDQSVVAGLGNIYVDETLHRCGLRPTRRANKLRPREVARLFEAIPGVLQEALDNRGTTFSDFRDADGEVGYHVNKLRVYGRFGSPCPACGEILRRTTVGGRTSSWCPACQK